MVLDTRLLDIITDAFSAIYDWLYVIFLSISSMPIFIVLFFVIIPISISVLLVCIKILRGYIWGA